jgi:hypothetical protein
MAAKTLLDYFEDMLLVDFPSRGRCWIHDPDRLCVVFGSKPNRKIFPELELGSRKHT